ncbi:MAG TPA: ATP-binding protein [Spirochaetales bacterium]|nr:ATP-binding protein [Spirochaetales bacterium]
MTTIKRIHIDNFKAMVDFRIAELPSLVCLIGLNGAGKTTFLQAFDFLGQLVHGSMKDWLANRGWESSDLRSKLGNKLNIAYEVDVDLDGYGLVTWKGTYQVAKGWSTEESVAIPSEKRIVVKTAGSKYTLDGETKEIAFDYEGSFLSRIKLVQGKHDLLIALRNFLLSLKSMELLSPHLLRGTSRRKTGDIGLGGEHLPVFLASLDAEKKSSLVDLMRGFYPHLKDWDIRSQKYGWKSLMVNELWNDARLATGSRHVNDGFLRLIAILAQSMGSHQVILCDEIENGITPELIEKLVDYLADCGKQVIITTHSPMVLNYIPDDLARRSVYLLYRTREGIVKAMRYFDDPETSRKLDMLGPGEVFVDTPIDGIITRRIQSDSEHNA